MAMPWGDVIVEKRESWLRKMDEVKLEGNPERA
jgi:hypothetical protein